MRGRKPTPIEQREREGNAGNRKLPARVQLPDYGVPKPPDLPDGASKLWDEIVPVLQEARVLNKIDAAALEALVIQWERGLQARQVLEEEGLVALGSTGQIVEHPMVATERAAHTLFIRFAEQFGITPVARARIAAAVHGVQEATMQEELARIGVEQ